MKPKDLIRTRKCVPVTFKMKFGDNKSLPGPIDKAFNGYLNQFVEDKPEEKVIKIKGKK